MTVALDGGYLLVFTGGIGENDTEVRAANRSVLSCIGIRLDEARNRSATNPISDPASRFTVWVRPSQEDEQISRHIRAVVGLSASASDEHER